MARDSLRDNIGISWIPDPDPDVFEYLVYWTTDDDNNAAWLDSIDSGDVGPDAVVVVPENQFLFPDDGQPEGADYAVVSHALNDVTGVQRWSSPYSPIGWQDIPLDQSAPELTGPTGGAVLLSG